MVTDFLLQAADMVEDVKNTTRIAESKTNDDHVKEIDARIAEYLAEIEHIKKGETGAASMMHGKAGLKAAKAATA